MYIVLKLEDFLKSEIKYDKNIILNFLALMEFIILKIMSNYAKKNNRFDKIYIEVFEALDQKNKA